LVVPTGTTFEFSYGPDSRRRHEEQARRLQLDLHVITESPWCFDVDEPEDLQGQRAKK
jgi:2-phospho-L-lactate guanylyltransferase (CobY/MobA/RfbA family)